MENRRPVAVERALRIRALILRTERRHAREWADLHPLDGNLRVAAQMQRAQRYAVIDALQTIDDGATLQRHTIRIRANGGIGVHAANGQLNLQFDFVRTGRELQASVSVHRLNRPLTAVQPQRVLPAPVGNPQRHA